MGGCGRSAGGGLRPGRPGLARSLCATQAAFRDGRQAACRLVAHAAQLVLHRAFDATAGRRMFADDLDEFLARHPQFGPLRARIGAFFAESRTAFFGPAAELPDAASCRSLCNDLARAERAG